MNQIDTTENIDNLFVTHSQVQILDPMSSAERYITSFLKKQNNVSVFSEGIQQKIRRAVTPFWQERYISIAGEEALLVRDLLLSPKFFLQTEFFVDSEPFPKTNPELLESALELASLKSDILEKKLISLSNGELRRVLLARLWMESPEWAYFNDPFGGLDPEYRKHLTHVLKNLAHTNIRSIFRMQREDELLAGIPAFVFLNGKLEPIEVKTETEENIIKKNSTPKQYSTEILGETSLNGEILFDLKNVTIRFGENEIIRNLNWQMRKGEHWVIMGPNGAGKSTFLALLSGDHPQMYNNDVVLLGMRPGQGLDVWEHKAQIGFFSPELALHYKEKLKLYEVLCTGFSSNLGLFQEINYEERAKALHWLKELGFTNPEISFASLSTMEKRLALVARAAIRPPKVLVLDEPTQGMDEKSRERLFDLLNFLSNQTSILFVSHYREWPKCMNRLLYMPIPSD